MEKTSKDYLVNIDAEAGGSGNNAKKIIKEKMPLPCISSVMETVLPPNAKISEDALKAVQSCLSEYIGLITSEAYKRSRCDKRKTIHPEDIIHALSKRGFNDYVAPLTSYLCRYRQHRAERNAERGEPSVRRTVSYPPYNDSHPIGYFPTQQPPTIPPAPASVYIRAPQAIFLPLVPPAPAVYYGGVQPSTRFASLHQTPVNVYYRFPVQASAIDHQSGLTFNQVYVESSGNAFPAGNSIVTGYPMNITGTLGYPMNVTGVFDAQAFNLHRGQFIPVKSMGVFDAQVSIPQSGQINPSNGGHRRHGH